MTTRNRNITIHGRTTTVALDDAFWSALDEIAIGQSENTRSLVTRIAQAAGPGRIAAGLRVYVIATLRAAQSNTP